MDLLLWTSFLLSAFVFTCDADVKVPLKAVVGSSITFPDSVKEKAFILLGTTNLASVSNGAFEIYEDIYTNRLHWSSSTGLFTLSHLQQNDSGVYTIDSKKGNVLKKIYELKLYEAVSALVVSSVNVSADSCTVQCSVKHTEQTTLSWFRGEQPVDSSTSAVLLLTVQLQDYTSQYRCVAQNPADNKAVIVNITTVCEHKETLSDTSSGSKAVYIVIPIVLTVLIIIIMAFVLYVIKKKCSKKESTPLQTEDSVQYAQITHCMRNQCSVPSAPMRSPDRPDLTTVYDQIKPERMAIYSNGGQEVM